MRSSKLALLLSAASAGLLATSAFGQTTTPGPSTWAQSGGGAFQWNAAGNWNPNTAYPSGVDAVATINGPASARTINYGTDITVGALTINNSTSGGTTMTGTAGGSLIFDAAGSGPAKLDVNGTGTGNTSIQSIKLNDDLVVTVNQTSATGNFGSSVLFNQDITGTGSLTKAGVGLMTINNVNASSIGLKTFSGALNLNDGRLRIFSNAIPTNISAFNINTTTPPGGQLTGGQLTLTNSSVYTFGASSAVPLNLNGAGPTSLPFSPFPGAIRQDTGLTTTIANNIVLQSPTTVEVQTSTVAPTIGVGSMTWTGVVSGPGSLTLTPTVSDNNLGKYILTNPANSYEGGTIINGGTLDATQGTLGKSTGPLTVNTNPPPFGGNNITTSVLLNTSAPTTTGSLSGANLSIGGVSSITLGGQLYTVNQTTAGTYDGVINGSGGLALGALSTATLTLTGANLYTNGTTVNAGRLQVTRSAALPSYATAGNVTVHSGGTLGVNAGAASGEWADSEIRDLYNAATFDAGSKLAIDTTSGNFAYGLGFTSATAKPVAIQKLGNNTLTLSVGSNYTGGTNVAAGTVVAGDPDALGSGPLNVADGATVKTVVSLAKALPLASVTTNAAGTLDLANNSMVIRSSNLAAVQAQIASGFSHGTWLGFGINSSAAAADSTHRTAIGYASNAVLNKSSFKGVTGLTSNDILVKYTYFGDADLNGVVTLDDFTQFLSGYQSNGSTWLVGDFDYNGKVTLDDFTLFLDAYQNQGAPLAALGEAVQAANISAGDRAMMLAAIQAVPEPTAIAALAVFAAAGTLRRRRRLA